MPETAPTASLLSPDDERLVRDNVAQSDRAAELTPALQALIHERGWLRMLAPKAAGGMELALPDAVRLEEALAAVDGSVGWTVTLCAGAGWFAGFLQPDFAREIIGTSKVCVGGSGAPTGFADEEGGGYRLTGNWEFATGAPLATHFTMNALIRRDGQPVLDNAGAQRIRAFIVPAAHVKVCDSWRSIGLRATASHSFSLDGVWVDARHAFDIDPANATAPGPLFRFPFVSLAYVTLAANLSGMALNFVGMAADNLALRRQRGAARPLAEVPAIAHALGHARASLAGARSHCYALLDAMWEAVCRGDAIGADEMDRLKAASMELVKASTSAVDALYPLCGLYAAHEDSDINRVWRDLHTATQHAMLLPV